MTVQVNTDAVIIGPEKPVDVTAKVLHTYPNGSAEIEPGGPYIVWRQPPPDAVVEIAAAVADVRTIVRELEEQGIAVKDTLRFDAADVSLVTRIGGGV